VDVDGCLSQVGWDEEISDCGEDADETLQRAWRTEPLHYPFPFSQPQVRVFGSIVQPLVRSMLDRRHDLALCSTIGAKLVCDDALGYPSLLLHQPDQKTLGSLGVPAYLDDLVEHIAVLVNGTPEPVFTADDCHQDLVQMPYIRWVGRFATQAASIDWPELLCPASDRLIRNDDAALQQHFLDQTQAQRKPEIQPDRMGDHSGRKTMAFVADWALAHDGEIAANLSATVNLTSPGKVARESDQCSD